MPTVFLLSRLKEGIDPAVYEKWVREFDYPTAKTIPSIVSYRNHRVHGPFRQADRPYQYIEIIEVTDIDAYRRDLSTLPQYHELRRQLIEYVHVESTQSYWGELIKE